MQRPALASGTGSHSAYWGGLSAPPAQRPADTGGNAALRQWKLTRSLSQVRLQAGLPPAKCALTHELSV